MQSAMSTDRDALPDFCHDEPYAGYFARLAAAGDAAAALRRLVPHLDADLDGCERLALWQALHALWQRLPAATREPVATCLDGRHAQALAALQRRWDDPALIEHLATQTATAQRAAFVPVLLAHHGIDPWAGTAAPPLVMLAARAAVAGGPRLDAGCITQVQAAVLDAAGQDAHQLPLGLAVLFELALHAADPDTATGVLAELLNHGQVRLLQADRVRAWLDGNAFSDDEDAARPLLLGADWQPRWLQPATWRQDGVLAALHGALRRAGPRQRLQQLAAMLQPLPAVPAQQPRAEALQALNALDIAYQLIDGGGDAVPVLRDLLDGQTLAPAAMAALWRGSARWHAARGDAEGELLALTQARRHQPTPALRAALAQRLPAPAPQLGSDWRDEEPTWAALLDHDDPALARLAALQLATLWTDGQLEPRPPRRCQRPTQAHELWQRLAAEPRYAPFASQALRQPLQTRLRPALLRQAGEDFLWFECPGAQAVTIVFSCIATHHSFAEVGALQGRLAGQHLLFVRCPDKNWYCDDSFDRVRLLLADRVAGRFAPQDVTCWYGSMGGHGALKFALAFGWRAIVFNPQTDLDLWAAFRPRERALLWGTRRHRRLADAPLAAWEQVPLYYACGAATADREALSVVIDRLRACHRLSAIIEKFDDPHHAGLMNRIAGGPVQAALQRIGTRLHALQAAPGLDGGQTLDPAGQAAFWDRLDAARALKVEVIVRDGRLSWQPSAACTPGIG